MHKLVITVLVGTIAVLLATGAMASPGDVDPTFGIGGTVRVDIGYFDTASDLVIQQDRRILAVGSVDHQNGVRNVFAVRLLRSGVLDPDFGTSGIVVPNRYHQVAPRVALQTDGKIVLATRGETDGGSVFLYRFQSDGTPDNSFGAAGIATLSPPAQVSVASVFGVGISTGEKIVVLLWVNTQEANIGFARFNSDGTPDASFGTNGFLVVPGYRIPYGLGLLPDGRMLVVGAAFLPGRFWSDAFIARFQENGALDTSFDSDGIALVQQPSNGSDFRAVEPSVDGPIYVGGREFGDNPYESRWLLAKFTDAGARDAAFGTAGLASYEPGAGDDVLGDILIQPFGVLAAGSLPSLKLGLPVVAFRESGPFDPTFGAGGFASTQEFSQFGTSRIASQESGRIVAFGSIQSWEPTFNQDLYLTRYEGFDIAPFSLRPRAKVRGISAIELDPPTTLDTDSESMQNDGAAPTGAGAGIQPRIELAVPNPSRHLSASLMLPDEATAQLIAYDTKGRIVSRHELRGLGPGRHVIQLSRPGELPSGVYLVFLTYGDRQLVSRAAVLR